MCLRASRGIRRTYLQKTFVWCTERAAPVSIWLWATVHTGQPDEETS